MGHPQDDRDGRSERHHLALDVSQLEETFAIHVRSFGLDVGMVREYKFHPERRWRLDFAWPEQMLAVEIEGGTWGGGRHTTGAGFEKDCEKYAEALVLGWRVLRVTGTQVRKGQAVGWLKRVLPSECKHCSAFFKSYRCGMTTHGECDCPKCQGMCECRSDIRVCT